MHLHNDYAKFMHNDYAKYMHNDYAKIMQADYARRKNSKCEKHEKLQGKGNIPHYFLGILKVSGGRRSRCAREVLERVAVP